jgi:hypothetical protein
MDQSLVHALAGLKERLAEACSPRQARVVEPEALISRDEVVAMLFGVADVNANLETIIDLLEQEFGGGEESEEEG